MLGMNLLELRAHLLPAGNAIDVQKRALTLLNCWPLAGANSICSMYVARFIMLALASLPSLEPDGGVVLGSFSNLFKSYRFFKLNLQADCCP